MKSSSIPLAAALLLWTSVVLLVPSLARAQAGPTIVSVDPPNGATGVPRSTSVVFTFSEAMDPTATSATFFYSVGPSKVLIITLPSWNGDNTVLTCTAQKLGFPVTVEIDWEVAGQSAAGVALSGQTNGYFSTIIPVQPPLVLTNAVWTTNGFSFEVNCSPGQTFTVESSSTMESGTWYPLLTTNTLGTSVQVLDPAALTNNASYYRARNGS